MIKSNLKLAEGEATLLDGTVLTVENNIIRKINGREIFGLRDIALSDKELTNIHSYEGDTIVITTDTGMFNDIKVTEEAWSKEIGKKVVILDYDMNTQNIFMEMLDKLNKIEAELKNIKNEKDGR